MPDHARLESIPTARVLGTAAAVVALLPGTAVAADDPLAVPLPAAPPLPVLDEPLPVPPQAAPVAPAAAPLAVVSSACSGARRRSGARRQRAAIRCLVNHARARAGLRGFRRSGALARAATRHARDMARRHYFAHQRAGGPSLMRRARRAGWRGRAIGEAIAYGCASSATPLTIVQSWLASPPHAAILLARGLRRSGVGVAGRAPVGCRGATYVLDAGS
jgi:uncharacterized protein YkwD